MTDADCPGKHVMLVVCSSRDPTVCLDQADSPACSFLQGLLMRTACNEKLTFVLRLS